MKVKRTSIEGCFEIEPKIINDKRGYFYESFNKKVFQQETGINTEFVQDNQSFSQRGVLRGLHLQEGDFSQAKLVSALQGKVLDVVVDLRKGSKTFGEVYSTLLSEENKKQLFVPRGCAHGFVVLSETALFYYKCDNFYNKEAEAGIIYNDKDLGIDWHLSEEELIISDKDLVLPSFKDYISQYSEVQ
ncbi:dTDP-4-dehydrorhamnose 3,5-epimerase [Zunongwangia atlantica]|uniref:dTDP-4-dehydrorhamnose 3,5-epimerase n=1 Tax=Zunongwangia atlantica 22II14-10F7 TaxID=1185767 RepID=A0A1Y1T5Q7_9FLAO|nr:dTDP-4-dehydrorhamnose 3,5-epimerase [Zunongwangia atlantica]ORL46370.1 dTDP-4-dehydrorhamnose 3,5-epimerase [Zunongwangia atlantica 22II14-10F7]